MVFCEKMGKVIAFTKDKNSLYVEKGQKQQALHRLLPKIFDDPV